MAKSLLKFRSEAFRRQAGQCFYCSVLMWTDDCVGFSKRHGLSPRAARWLQCTAEHLCARQDGGRHAAGNIVAACRLCNHRRHAQRKIVPTPDKHRALVQRRVSRKRWHAPQVFERGLIAIR